MDTPFAVGSVGNAAFVHVTPLRGVELTVKLCSRQPTPSPLLAVPISEMWGAGGAAKSQPGLLALPGPTSWMPGFPLPPSGSAPLHRPWLGVQCN